MRIARTGFGAVLAFAVGLASLAAASPAAGRTPWYQVEVVIFAEGGESRWDRDDWREEGPPPLPGNTVELLSALATEDEAGVPKRRHAFRALPSSELTLEAAADRLDRATEYRVLLHLAWQQPGFPYEDAPAVHIGTLRRLVSDDRLANPPEEAVDGTVRLWRRRFLHLEADLAFGEIEAWRRREDAAATRVPRRNESAETPGAGAGEPASAAASVVPDAAARETAGTATRSGAEREASLRPPGDAMLLRVARLTRSFRLRAGRLYYVDHPLFGMLLRVRRLD